MAQQPPAFQFYAKDWLTSETVLGMRPEDEGTYIRTLAASWTSADPGTLPLPLSLGAKVCRIPPQRLAAFLGRNPTTWIEQEGRLVNLKLRQQWLESKSFLEFTSKRGKKGAHARWHKHHASSIKEAMPNDSSASASASASAIKSNTTPLTPHKNGGGNHPKMRSEIISCGPDRIEVTFPANIKRLWTESQAETMVGARASDWIEFFKRRGWDAKIVRTQ